MFRTYIKQPHALSCHRGLRQLICPLYDERQERVFFFVAKKRRIVIPPTLITICIVISFLVASAKSRMILSYMQSNIYNKIVISYFHYIIRQRYFAKLRYTRSLLLDYSISMYNVTNLYRRIFSLCHFQSIFASS